MVGILFLDKIFHISPELISDVRLLFAFIFVNFRVVTMSTAFNATAHVKNKPDVTGVFKVLAYLLEADMLVVCFTLLRPSVAYVGMGRALEAVVPAAGGKRLPGDVICETPF